LDTLFTDGHFWVGPSSSDWATELFVSNGLVAPRPQKSEGFTRVKLGGKYAYPSFRDGHAHPLQGGRENFGPRLTGLASISEIIKAIEIFAEEHPDIEWIVGGNYDRDLSVDGRFEASWLDEAVLNRPVVLHSNDHHALWLNTEALRRTGFLTSQPTLESGSIDVDESGRATGVIREWPAMNIVLRSLPPRSRDERLTALTWAQHEMLRHGITEVQDAWVDETDLDTYLAAAEEDLIKVRTHLAIVLTPANWQTEIKLLQESMDAVKAVKNPQLVLNSAKIFVDGSFGNATASVLEPYVSKDGSSDFGQSLWQLEELVEVIRTVRASGLQPHLHAIGDAAIRLALDSLDRAQTSEKTQAGLPAVIAHSELIADSDIHRYKQLSIIANLQPLWARQDDMMTGSELKLGGERSQRLYRMRDLLDCGAMLSFGSDWPVSDLSPLLGIMTAVSRQTPDGRPEGGWTPGQRVTLSEALLAYSDGTAKQLGNLSAGSLLLGKSADFLVLDKNVFDLPPLDLPNLEAQAVYVAGELIYNRL
jgi:hypothetical protein